MKKISIIIGILLFMLSCTKHKDSENPVITVLKPVAESMVNSNEVIVSFTIEDDDMHSYGYQILTSTNDSLLLDYESHAHETVNYIDTFAINVSAHTDTKIIIDAEDHNGNTATKTINFSIHPIIN